MVQLGIFTIITNDGKQDRILMATALLHERLRAINAFKVSQKGGKADALHNLPTLLDIEKTHVLFTNAHFKPFAAIGFEYNKVRATSGNPSLGSIIQFSIPQFGDFFHDICVHAVLSQPTLVSTATEPGNQPAMRWCNFPGERLLKKVQQEVNGNPLDEYTYHATNMHREYRVAPNKIRGWNRCVGQEEPEKGFVDQPSWVHSGVDSTKVTHRVSAHVHTGAQTPTGQKDVTAAGDLELFIPLLFWYNKDVRLAVPSVAIPYGQRFINVELATMDELVSAVPRGGGTHAVPQGSLTAPAQGVLKSIELYINNIFVNPEVHKIYIRRIGFSLIRVHRQQLYNANSTGTELLLQQLKWPIEYLFVGMKVKSYHAGSSVVEKSEAMDRWHKFSSVTNTPYKTTGQDVLQTTQFVETADLAAGTLGVAATGVLTGTSSLLQEVVDGVAVKIGHTVYTVITGAAAGAAATAVTVAPAPAVAVAPTNGLAVLSALVTYQGLSMTTEKCVKTFNSLTIKAHGIPIYDNYPAGFFNAYTTYHYGGPNINTPEDCGLCFIPFCLYPGTYQPSGHINVSRAREFYLNWDSSVIDTNNAGTLVVIASAINFLLISDGKQYSLAVVVIKVTASPIHWATSSNCGKLSSSIVY
jgi:hypothetical protein